MKKITQLLVALAITLCQPMGVFAAKSGYRPYKPSYRTPSYKPYSYPGQISPKTHRPKNVYVRDYHRRDGTHVHRHYRSKRK
jgi:hypothetical protein